MNKKGEEQLKSPNIKSPSTKILEVIAVPEKKSAPVMKTMPQKKKEAPIVLQKQEKPEKNLKVEQKKKPSKEDKKSYKQEKFKLSDQDQKDQYHTEQLQKSCSPVNQQETIQVTKSSNNTSSTHFSDQNFQSSIIIRDSSIQSDCSKGEESKQPTLVKQLSQNYQNLLLKLKEKNVLLIKEDQIYNTCTCIGKGAFGVVFRGKWMNLDVAIKEIVVSYEEIGIMLSELEFLSKCRYPQIISFYGLSIKELTMGNTVQCQLVMELMKTDLDSLIFKGQYDRNLKVLVKILHQVTSAVQFLHNSEIVHRDIKPQNILIDEKFNAKLSDLGIAKVLENKVQTQNATIAFTMCYASPETALEEITSFKSDIWSLGILFYEVLTGKRAWEQFAKKSKIIVALSMKQSPFVQNWEDYIQSSGLVDLIKKTVNYDVDERYTADQVYESLNQIYNKLH